MTATEVSGSGPSGPAKQRHPVAGFLLGVVFGLGLALCAVNFKLVELQIVTVVAIVVVGIVAGVVWSTVGPVKKPKGVSAGS